MTFATHRSSIFRKWTYEGVQLDEAAVEVAQAGDDVRIFTISGDAITKEGDCLAFLTSHQAVKVYAGEELIYSVELSKHLFGNSVGDSWNFVSVPNGVEEIRVELTAAYPQSRDPSPEFLAGDAIALYREILAENFLPAMVSLLNFIFGLVIILFWVIFHKKEKAFDSLVFFGILSACMGMWAFVENDVAVLLSPSTGALNVTAYFCLMLMPVACVLFLRDSLNISGNRVHIAVCVYSLVVTIVFTLLMVFHVMDFKQVALWIHVGLLLVVGYLVYGVVQKIYTKSITRHILMVIIAMGTAFVALILGLLSFYSKFSRSRLIGPMGLLICIMLLALETFMETYSQVEEGRKAIYYKQMASVDTLTGVYNRNAFMEDTSAMKESENVYIVTFDLNDLKKTNDTKGHEVGDRYLIDAAAAISYVFSQYGSCYRIGGDEFCVVIKDDTAEHVESMIARLKRCEEDYNRESKSVVMKIACGYATFDPERDRNLEETRTRADARMYADKVQMKANHAAD